MVLTLLATFVLATTPLPVDEVQKTDHCQCTGESHCGCMDGEPCNCKKEDKKNLRPQPNTEQAAD